MRTLWQVFQQKTTHRSDADLLCAFSQQKSEDAFRELVEKYGGMVLSVCQRHLGHRQDAEDAFQATFLVLAKRAAQLHASSPLSCWLYGVARRVAMKARTQRPRELHLIEESTEVPLEDMTMASHDGAELRSQLDDSIASLPEPYRAVLVLCLLNDFTKAEAASQLGCPEGTVSSRLMRAREMLRHKLVRRGIGLSSLALLEPLLAPASVSALLVQSTVNLGMKVAVGASITAGTSSTVLNLAQGVTQAMYITKLKLTALGLIVATGLTVGTGYVAGGWGQDKNSTAAKPAPSNVKPGVASQAAPKKGESATKADSLVTDASTAFGKLNQPSETMSSLVGQELPLDEYLHVLEKELGLVSIIDSAAFRNVFAEFNHKEFRDQKINMPRMTNQSAGTILHTLLDNITYQGQALPATFLVRRGTLVIVPQDYLYQAASKIQVALDTKTEDMTLADALERLSQDTGISIILDSRMQETARETRVKTSFRNIKLINAVRVLANMANMTVINIDGALYVSSEENCKRMEEEMARGGA